MKMSNEWIKQNTIALIAAASLIGIKKEVLEYQIECGELDSREGRIRKIDCENICKQKKQYLGIKAFILTHNSKKFIAKYVNNRNKYTDFLEQNDYFGVELYSSKKMLFALPEKEEFYIHIQDIEYLNFKSLDFFDNFGLTEENKVNRILNCQSNNIITKKYIDRYMSIIDTSKNIFTESFTAFVETAFGIDNLIELTDTDILALVDNMNTIRTKELFIDFLSYISNYEKVMYSKLKFKKKESTVITAYSYKNYTTLAKMIFSDYYDKTYGLTLKALENHIYAETWLYISIHYICGWRPSDICAHWIYLNIEDSNNTFNINPLTLKADIINNNIPNDTYKNITQYVLQKIELSVNCPHKTNNHAAGKLRCMVTPDLLTFYGKLILIGEYHHINNNNGYIKLERTFTYCSWVNCREFFGEEFYIMMGKNNLSSRRLNKSYLQGIEDAALKNGNTNLASHIVASFARNHINSNSTITYLKDHGLTGESADVVLYMMMQRGVMSSYLYNALVVAFPEQFEKLTLKEQTEIMIKIDTSGYELELFGSVLVASNRIKVNLTEGKTKESIQILKEMYEVGQGHGKAKDIGIYCKKRALGEVCIYPKYRSCIANICPFHVFTRDGIPTLVNVIKDYIYKAKITGNIKYEIVLKQKIIPAFNEVLDELFKNMSSEEKKQIEMYIVRSLDE